MKLFDQANSTRARQIQVTAKFLNLPLEFTHTEGKELKNKTFLAKNPLGKGPILEHTNGCLFETNAIARYLARFSKHATIYGTDENSSSLVDQWLDFVLNEVAPPQGALVHMIFGSAPTIEEVTKKARTDLNNVLKVLNTHLQTKTFLVGNEITLADLSLASELFHGFLYLFDEKFRKNSIPHITRWFKQISELESFSSVFGKVWYCTKEFPFYNKPAPVEKKEDKKKAEPVKKAEKPKKVEEEEEEPKEKKKNPLEELPESPFNFFDYKTEFVNNPNKQAVLNDTFYKNFDKNGYSIWFLDYNKADGEGEKCYLTNNLMNGYLQRLDHFRKFSFAMMGVYGDEPNLDIKGCWIWRGTSIPLEISDHDQAEYYKYTQCNLDKPEDKKLFEEYWTGINEDESKVNGRVVRTSKYFK